jgi:predicted MFS family arabinose efflux permease
LNADDVNRPAAIAAGIWVLVAGAFVYNVLPAMVGAAAETLGLNARQVGFLASADLIGAVAACITSLFWIRRVNWRVAATIGLVILIVGNLVAGRMQTYEGLVLVRSFCGVGMGTAVAVGLAALSDVKNQERIFGIVVVVQVTFAATAVIIFPHLAQAWGMAGVFNFLAGAAALSLVATRFLVRRGVEKPALKTLEAGALLWPLMASLGLFLFSVAQGGVWAYSERIGNALGIAPGYVGTILAAGLMVGVLGAAAAAWLADRISYLAVFVIVTVCEVVSFFMMSHGRTGMLFVIGVCLFNVMWNFGVPYAITAIIKSDLSGRFVVLVPVMQGLGVGLGPAFIAMLISGNNLGPVGYVGSAAIVLCLLAYLPVARRLDRQGRIEA